MKVKVTGDKKALLLAEKFSNIGEKVALAAEPELLRSVQDSIRARAFRTGRLLRSVRTEITQGRKIRLRAFSPLNYAAYIERGTSRMSARYPFRIGIAEARPKIADIVRQITRETR